MIEKEPAQGSMMSIGLSHWTYHQTWYRVGWAEVPRLFHPASWAEMQEWENQLRELAVERAEAALLRAQEARAIKREPDELLQLEGRRELVG